MNYYIKNLDYMYCISAPSIINEAAVNRHYNKENYAMNTQPLGAPYNVNIAKNPVHIGYVIYYNITT